MKKLLYLSILLLTITQARAQENRGTLVPAKIFKRSFMVGGSASGAYRRINITNNNESLSGNRWQLDFDTKVGYFVMSDVAVGLRASVHHYEQKMSGQISTFSTYLLGGPFARYYWDNGLFAEGSAAYGKNNRPDNPKTDIFEYRAGMGYAIFLHPKIAIEPALMFNLYQEIRPAESNRKLTEWGPSLNLGLQVYLFRERRFNLSSRRML